MKVKYFLLNKRLRTEKQLKDIKNLSVLDIRKILYGFAKRLPDVVHLRELVALTFFISIFMLILFVQRFKDLDNYFIEKIPAFGGLYVEGVVGDAESFNPLYEGLNPVEDDVNSLVYSGLVRNQNGTVTPGIAKSWEVSEEGRVYTFHLREDVKWHDGDALDVADVLYTYQAIQDPDVRSTFSGIFRNVTAEGVDQYTFKLTLAESQALFLNNLDLGILPSHLYEKTPGRNMKVAEQNQTPVGSGPFRFEKIEKKKDYTLIFLRANADFSEKPYISKLRIRTYKDEGGLLDGYSKKEIMAMNNISVSRLGELDKFQNILFMEKFFPRYVALFFNQKSEIMKSKGLRTALALSLDENELYQSFDKNKIMDVKSSLLPGTIGYQKDLIEPEYNPAQAVEILKSEGYQKGESFWAKDGKELAVSLYTSDRTEFKNIAEKAKEQWERAGIKVDLNVHESRYLQEEHIKPRKYDILLYGVNAGKEADFFNLWHTSQRDDPGLNLSYFSESKVDKYIELSQKGVDPKKSEEMLFKAQDIIYPEIPAIFLYSPSYNYVVNKSVKGVDISKITKPSDRFSNIEKWYIREENK